MFEAYSTVELVVGALSVAATSVGLYIGYHALRAFRRHGDPAMRFLATGLLLLTAVTYGLTFVGTVLLQLRLLSLPQQDWFWLAVHLTQLAGLVCIAIAVRSRPGV